MKLLLLVNPTLAALEAALMPLPGLEVTRVESAADLERRLDGAEILVVSNSRYDVEVASVLRRAGHGLRWVQFTSAGVETWSRLGGAANAVVTNAGGMRGAVVAEHAMALVLALLRGLQLAEADRRERYWRGPSRAAEVASTAGRTLLSIGYGAIGRELARKAAAFDMRVVALNRTGAGGPPAEVVLPITRLHEALPSADVVVLCVPLSDSTRSLIAQPEIAIMKPSALLVNVARGDVIEEDALIEALRQGLIGGAGLDVVSHEPLPKEHLLWSCPRTLITPHIGGRGIDAVAQLAVLVQENLARLRQGRPLLNRIGHLPSE